MSWNDLIGTAQTIIVNTLDEGSVEYFHEGDFVPIKGVFDNGHVPVEVGEVVGHSSTRPTLFVKVALLPAAPANGGKVKVKGTTYRIIDSQEDGQGGTTLVLHEE